MARIHAAVARLSVFDAGRPSRLPGLRELSVRDAPYVIVYEVNGDDVDLLAIYHTSQDR